MFKLIFRIIFILFSILFLFYLSLPSPDFPKPPSDSVQSREPADTESPLRRAYFTNFTREEVMDHYKRELSYTVLFGISLPTYRLNYPPEESSTIIRDQTRSTFLEEVVHPFRESVFINGFEPKDAKDAIMIDGVSWRQKLIIKYEPSMIFVRLFIGALTLALIFVLVREYGHGKDRN